MGLNWNGLCFIVKGTLLSKALVLFFSYINKMAILSRRRIPMYEQFIHLTQITLRLIIQLLNTLQHAYQSF